MNSIPNDVMQILRNRELTPDKRLIAYTMLVPGLPVSPAHALAWQSNIQLGKNIKELIDNGTVTITGMDKNSILSYTSG